MAGFRPRLSESEKEKGVASSLSPSIDQSPGPKLLGVAARARRDISGDVADLIVGRLDGAVNIPDNLGKNDEVVGSDSDLLSVRVENNRGKAIAVDARDGSVDLKSAEVVWCRLIPFRLGSDGSIEQLLDLPPENSRPSVVSGQDWEDVLPTQSSVGTVSLLLKGCKACGVTFIIPRAEQRPWSAPIGYHCVYESFFEEDSRLWFPIPRLITSYCSRRGIALTQLMTGIVRIAVALAVMAAEIDVSMSDHIFEELTQIQPKPNGLYTVQMRSGLQILTGHPSRTMKDWHRFYFYVKADEFAFEETLGDDFQVLWSHCIGR